MKTTVLITGATAGIGRFLALDLARRGLRVFATGRSEDALASLRAEEPLVETLRLDVLDQGSIDAARARVDELTEKRGLDVLVNNAGYGLAGAVEDLALADLRHEFETNFFGLVAVTQAFVPRMRERRSGRVLNVSSVAGRVCFPFFGAYHASKFAVEGLTDCLRAELAAFGVKVVLIEPGPIKSEFADRSNATLEKARQAGSPYQHAYEKALAYKESRRSRAPGPECVARAVRHAIESSRPKARYVMPFSSRVLAAAHPFIPTRLWDRLVRKRAGLLSVLVASSLALGAVVAGGPASARAQDPAPVSKALGQRIREATLRAAHAMAANPPKRAPMKDARTLVALALLRGGGRDERKVARELLDGWWADATSEKWITPSGNYELALYIQAVEGLSLVRIDDPSSTQDKPRFRARPPSAEDRARLERATRALVAGGVPSFDGKGLAWGYGAASLAEGATTQKGVTTTNGREKDYWDNSNAQFSVLALHEAARAGVPVAKDLAEKVGRHFLLAALEMPAALKKAPTGTGEGAGTVLRWGYKKDDRVVRESMLFAGLSSLAIARELGWKDAEVDAAIARGLEGSGPFVRRGGKAVNDEPGWGDSYQLYSIEKALDLLGVSVVEGKEWFPPLAEGVLAEQQASGLWKGDAIDTSFYVIFLTRGTLSGERLVTSGGSGEPGDVVSPKSKKVVNAPALVRAFAKAEGKDATKARAEAEEAVSLLAAEGHGQDACLLRALAEIAGSKAEAVAKWSKEIAGEPLSKAQLESAAASLEALRDTCDIAALRGALFRGSVLPVRAFAAGELAVLKDRAGVGVLADACDALAEQPHLLTTGAGARCARAFADALTGLLAAALPELPAKGNVPAAQLKAVAKAAREKSGAK